MATPKAGRLYAGQTPEARVTERRRAFLDAARQLIGTKGYDAATVRAVCAEAGLTDRYFYESFDDTEALLRAVYSEISDELRAAITGAIAGAGADIEDKLDAGLKAYVEMLRDPVVARILLLEVLGVSPAVTALYLKTTADFASLLLDEVVRHLPALAHHAEDRVVLGHALVGAMSFAVASWALSGYRKPAATVVRNCRRVLLGTVKQFAADVG